MKTKLQYLLTVLAMLAGVHPALGQVVINSVNKDGVLTCSGLQTGTVASVQCASSLLGPWQTSGASLGAVAVSSNGTITVSVPTGVPMFYRVFGVPAPNAAPPPPGMVRIAGGKFTMGDTLDGERDAIPVDVTVSTFFMDANLVSYIQWINVYNYAVSNKYTFAHAGSCKALNHPVPTGDWFDCVKWCNARSKKDGLKPVYFTDTNLTQVFTNGDKNTMVYANWAANGYRLPTEAEWEKAARGGLKGQRFPWGNTISENQANYYGCTVYSYDLGPNYYNSRFNFWGVPFTSPVGFFAPNNYGLYDMAGNVWEWCWDWYAGPPYPAGSPYLGGTDPHGPVGPLAGRELRGGVWNSFAVSARCAYRSYNVWAEYAGTGFGFRCVRGH